MALRGVTALWIGVISHHRGPASLAWLLSEGGNDLNVVCMIRPLWLLCEEWVMGARRETWRQISTVLYLGEEVIVVWTGVVELDMEIRVSHCILEIEPTET